MAVDINSLLAREKNHLFLSKPGLCLNLHLHSGNDREDLPSLSRVLGRFNAGCNLNGDHFHLRRHQLLLALSTYLVCGFLALCHYPHQNTQRDRFPGASAN